MDKIKELITTKEIYFVRLESEDMHGISRGFTLDVDYFLETVFAGIPFCRSANSCSLTGDLVSGTGLLDEIDYQNGYLYPDLDTFRVLPWLQNTASVLVDFRNEHKKPSSDMFSCSPRSICKKQIERLQEKGMQIYSAYEFEFYLLEQETKKPVYDMVNVYSTLDNTICQTVMQRIMRNMKGMQIFPEVYHTEFGPAQQEITNKPAFGVQSADNAFRLKHLAKEVAKKNNLIATFLSKPFDDYSGSSGHFNHSLWNFEGDNLFYDPERDRNLSEISEYWLAGLRYHSEALTCFACPTTNCYRRFLPGCFAPMNNLWGLDNRTVGYRVKTMGKSGTYIENRVPGAAVNPYLLMAATIIAGLDGINKKMKQTSQPFVGDIATATEFPADMKILPNSLIKALDHLNSNEVFVNEFGDDFLKCFTKIKQYENDKELSINEEKRCKWYLDNYTPYL